MVTKKPFWKSSGVIQSLYSTREEFSKIMWFISLTDQETDDVEDEEQEEEKDDDTEEQDEVLQSGKATLVKLICAYPEECILWYQDSKKEMI